MSGILWCGAMRMAFTSVVSVPQDPERSWENTGRGTLYTMPDRSALGICWGHERQRELPQMEGSGDTMAQCNVVPGSAPGLEIDMSGRTGQIQTQSAAQLMNSTAFVSNSSDTSTVFMWNGNTRETVSNVYWNSLHSFAIFYKFNIISKERVRIGIYKSEIKLSKIFNLHFLNNANKMETDEN